MERRKVMRAIKEPDFAFIERQRIHYDYSRPHTALEAKTLTQTTEIELNLTGNKWEAIIMKSSKERNDS